MSACSLSFYITGMSVLGYFKSELTRGYLLEGAQEKFTERRERVYTFMKTPRELEKVSCQKITDVKECQI